MKNQNLGFTIDGAAVGTYTNTPSDSNYHYNVPFFGQSNLSPGIHTIQLSVEGTSFVLVDYFVYTANPMYVFHSHLLTAAAY